MEFCVACDGVVCVACGVLCGVCGVYGVCGTNRYILGFKQDTSLYISICIVKN